MSATNATTHYGLSQFIGTDVPGWLSDYNGDNAKIDTAIFNAKSEAEAAATTATQATNDINTINGTLTTQAAQISAAAQAASQAQTSAGTALNTAQTADGKADTNATAISDLDTRVTALEGDGGGGVEYMDVPLEAGATNMSGTINVPLGKTVVNALFIHSHSSQTDLGYITFLCQEGGLWAYRIRYFLNGQWLAPGNEAGTLRVYLTDVA